MRGLAARAAREWLPLGDAMGYSALVGFPGESAEPGHRRLYLDVFLAAYVDIPDEALLHAQEIPRGHPLLGGRYVWMRRSAGPFKKIRKAYRKVAQVQKEYGDDVRPDGGRFGVIQPAWPTMLLE